MAWGHPRRSLMVVKQAKENDVDPLLTPPSLPTTLPTNHPPHEIPTQKTTMWGSRLNLISDSMSPDASICHCLTQLIKLRNSCLNLQLHRLEFSRSLSVSPIVNLSALAEVSLSSSRFSDIVERKISDTKVCTLEKKMEKERKPNKD